MKVALLTGGKDPHYACGLVRELTARGVRVALIGGTDLADCAQAAGRLVEFQDFVGRPDAAGRVTAKVWRVLTYYARLLLFAARTDIKVFHLLWFRKFPQIERTLLNAYFKLLGKKLVFTAHNVDDRARDGRVGTFTERLSLRLLYRTVAHICVHTAGMKRELLERFHVADDKVTIVPFGVNDVIPVPHGSRSSARRRLGLGMDDRVLLFFGNIAPYKGLEDLIRALALLVREDRRFLLVLAGRIKDRSCEGYWREIEQLISDLELGDHIRREIRYLHDDEVGLFFRAADVAVLPYRRVYQSGVLALSYAQGLPVIVADVGSMREDVIEGETGFSFEAGDERSLAAAVQAYFATDLCRNLDDRRQAVQAYGAQRFSWTSNADRTCAVYRRLTDTADVRRRDASASPDTPPPANHFDTQHLLRDLKHRAVSSSMVLMAAQCTKVALYVVIVMVLNRLLVPSDFGLVAMVTSVLAVLSVFKDAGLSTPTVQRDSITHAQVSNLFWINVVLSGSASLFVIALAPAIVWFFKEPRLLDLSMILAWILLLNGMTVQPRAILSRQMRFNVISAIDVLAIAAGGAVGLGMALEGFGYWSLAGQLVTTECVLLVLIWFACGWRPGRPRRSSGTRPLVTFGATLATSNLLFALARSSDVALLGRFFGSDAAGLYSRAVAVLIRPLDQLLPALNSVFVPALSRVKHDPERYRRAFLRTYDSIALIAFPAAGIMLGLADPLTSVLFGPGWSGVTPIFASVAIAAAYLVSSNVATWIFYSSGRGSAWLKASSLLSVLTMAAFVVGLPFGPVGVALAHSVAGIVVLQPVLFHLAGRHGPVTARDLWRGVFTHLPLWAVAYTVSSASRALTAELSPLSALFVCVPIASLCVLLVATLIAPVRHSAMDLLEAVKGFRVRCQQVPAAAGGGTRP